jgi:hypothetical protein
MGFRIGEFGHFSLGDHLEVGIDLVFYDTGDFMASEINVEEDVCEGFLEVVGVNSHTIHNCQTMIYEEHGIEAFDIFVGGNNHCGIQVRETVLVSNDTEGKVIRPSDVLVQQEGVLPNAIVFLLDVV